MWGWPVLTLVVCLGACQPAPSTQPLAERVTAFWEARLQGDEVTAYQYETHAHTGAMTLTQYIRARSSTLKYMAYTIDTIQEQENEAQVTVNLQYRLTVPGMVDLPLAMAIQERWVRLDDSQWYRNIKSKKPGTTARRQG